MGLLDAIANPTLADIPAAFEKRDKKQAMDMAGEILGSTVQGKLGALFNKDPILAMKVAKATGTPTDSKGRMDHLIGTIKFANKLVKGGMPGEAGIILTEGAEKINAVAPGQAEKMMGMGAAVGQGDTEALNNLNTLDMSFSQTVKPVLVAQGASLVDPNTREVIYQGEAKPETTTALEKNIVAAGFVKGTPEFQKEMTKQMSKSSTTINLGDKGVGKEQEELAKIRAKQLSQYQEDRDIAIDVNQSLDVLENIDVNTGALEPAKQGLAAFGKAFGIDTSGIANVSAAEAFNAEAKKMVLSVKATQKGPQTDKDENTIASTVANLGNTKEGNQFVINSSRALSNRKIERADFFDNFLDENETLKGANRAWAKFKRSTPMVSSKLKSPLGLPVFFYEFEKKVRNANPDASRADILEAWRASNK
jgi:hypothetical protein